MTTGGNHLKHNRKDYNNLAALDARIPDDEPVFLLRGQDAAAATAVRAYADQNDRCGGDPEISKSARDQAVAMDAWQPSRPATLNAPKQPAPLQTTKDTVGEATVTATHRTKPQPPANQMTRDGDKKSDKQKAKK